jgi:hypothetical protein
VKSGAFSPTIQVIPSSSRTRKISARVKPILRARPCWSWGSLPATIEIKMMLSMPSTISIKVSVRRLIQVSTLKKISNII